MVTFKSFLKKKKIKLHSWQQRAALNLLKEVQENKHASSGKTFLMDTLRDFICFHGNDFKL